MKKFIAKEDLNYLASSVDVVAEIDRKTLLWELKYQLKSLHEFAKRLKSRDLKIIEISAGFFTLKQGFVDMLKKFSKQVNSVSVVKEAGWKITDPKKIIPELRTLFQVPLENLIDEVKENIVSDNEIINYLESFIKTAKVWQDRTQW